MQGNERQKKMSKFLKNLSNSAIIILSLSASLTLLPGIGNSTEILTIKPHATVHSDIVTLGDLFTNVKSQAAVPLFKSPPLGRQGKVSITHLIDAAERLGFTFNTPLNLKEITVSRPARTIKVANFEQQLQYELAKHLQKKSDQNITLIYATPLSDQKIPLHFSGELKLKKFTYNKSLKKFRAIFTPSDATSNTYHRLISGTASLTITRPVLAHALKRGETISKSDLIYKEFNPYRVPKNSLVEAEKIYGQTLTKNLRSGSFLKDVDIETPKIIKKNQLVTLIYKKSGLSLKTQGKAIDDGGLNESIAIMNIHSKRIVHGIVKSPGVVVIQNINTNIYQKTAHLNQLNKTY